MINNDELKYKLEAVIEYLKDNGGYDYKLYNQHMSRYGRT